MNEILEMGIAVVIGGVAGWFGHKFYAKKGEDETPETIGKKPRAADAKA